MSVYNNNHCVIFLIIKIHVCMVTINYMVIVDGCGEGFMTIVYTKEKERGLGGESEKERKKRTLYLSHLQVNKKIISK